MEKIFLDKDIIKDFKSPSLIEAVMIRCLKEIERKQYLIAMASFEEMTKASDEVVYKAVLTPVESEPPPPTKCAKCTQPFDAYRKRFDVYCGDCARNTNAVVMSLEARVDEVKPPEVDRRRSWSNPHWEEDLW